MAKKMKDDFADPWDLLGDPGAFGLPDFGTPGDWGPAPDWGGYPTDLPDPSLGLDTGSGDQGGGSSGGSLGSWASILSRFLGGNGGGSNGGGLNLANLLPLLAITGGGINQNSNINHATDAMLAANNNATSFLQGQLGATSGRFDPYTNAGAGALQRIQAMPPSNIAAGFKPLGSGRGLTTLGSLAGRR